MRLLARSRHLLGGVEPWARHCPLILGAQEPDWAGKTKGDWGSLGSSWLSPPPCPPPYRTAPSPSFHHRLQNANQRKALWQAWKAENGKDYADGTPDDYVRCVHQPGAGPRRGTPSCSAARSCSATPRCPSVCSFAAWSANLDAMIKSNQKQGGGHLHGLNPFSDLTFDEFKGQVLMPDQARAAVPATTGAPKFVPGGASSTRKLMQITPPATWDWRAKGKVRALLLASVTLHARVPLCESEWLTHPDPTPPVASRAAGPSYSQPGQLRVVLVSASLLPELPHQRQRAHP